MSNTIELAVLNFSKYVKPKEVEQTFNNWVMNGKNNEFFQYIIDRNNGSATNGSINRSYTDLIIGQGLTFKPNRDGSSKNAQDWARLNQILTKKDIRRIAADFQVFGASALEVQTNNKNELINIGHIPREQVIPSVETDEGIIESYWHSRDWNKQWEAKYTPVNYPAFGTSKEGIEIFMLESYTVGQKYFESPWYISGLQYAEAEEEISNMYNNAIKKGLSAGYILNVKNGINWTPEEKRDFKKKVTEKLTGSSNTGSFIISFGGEDVAVEVTELPVAANLHKQWEVLNETCVSKIMTAHRAISTSIIGVTPNTGFSSSGEEMDTAERQLMKRVISPRQKMITDALETILQTYDINLDLYFKPLTEEPEESKAVEMSSDEKKKNFSDADGELMLENLIGETITDEWELVDKRECLEENEDVESWANRLIKPIQLAVIKSKPNDKSYLDKEIYKVRYTYQQKYSSGRSRQFCNDMMGRTDNGVVYRKEDIDQASFQGLNKSFGHQGQSYSLFKYKGGVNCGHYWQEELYRLKKKTDGTYRPDKALSSSEEVESIPKSYTPTGESFETSKIAPKDMPNNGHHPNYRKGK